MKLLTQGKVLTALHRGAVIMADHIGGSEPKTVYRLSSNQRIVSKPLMQMLLANNLIKANNDGLFGDYSQTFSVVRSGDKP